MAKITDIVKSVRTILDHNLSNSQLEDFQVLTTLDIDTVIENSVEAGAMQLLQMAPVEIVDHKTCTNTLSAGVSAPITMTLPDDFLRFISCELSGWSVPVTELSPVGSREHIRQYGEFDGLKATNIKPVAVMTMDNLSSQKLLMMYGGELHHAAFCHYVGMPEFGTDATTQEQTINISDRLYNPLCYIIAALVCEVLKDTQKSQYLIQTARSLMTSAEGAEEQIIRTNT